MATRVAAFAHKYAAPILLTDADQFLSDWLPDRLSSITSNATALAPIAAGHSTFFPSPSIASSLGTCAKWTAATWLSWLDFFGEQDLPLLRASCSGWLVDHTDAVSTLAAHLGTLRPATTASLCCALAQELSETRQNLRRAKTIDEHWKWHQMRKHFCAVSFDFHMQTFNLRNHHHDIEIMFMDSNAG